MLGAPGGDKASQLPGWSSGAPVPCGALPAKPPSHGRCLNGRMATPSKTLLKRTQERFCPYGTIPPHTRSLSRHRPGRLRRLRHGGARFRHASQARCGYQVHRAFRRRAGRCSPRGSRGAHGGGFGRGRSRGIGRRDGGRWSECGPGCSLGRRCRHGCHRGRSCWQLVGGRLPRRPRFPGGPRRAPSAPIRDGGCFTACRLRGGAALGRVGRCRRRRRRGRRRGVGGLPHSLERLHDRLRRSAARAGAPHGSGEPQDAPRPRGAL